MKRFYRRLLGGFCAFLLLISLHGETAKAQEISVSAQSAVLISADTLAVLYEKNADQQLSMASTTKIMTALLALEEAEKAGDPVVFVTEEMVAVEGSSMGLQAGNEITLTNLAAGMLLASGNDAANAAALYLSGTQEKFADRMNRRAEELGMKNTHFVTPSGLDDDEHFSTAYDMALLAQEALKNENFRKLCSSSTYQVTFQEPEQKISYTNHNKLLRFYEGCIGVKTGFTKKSGRCLVSAAERDGITLIAVTLNAPDDWNDHMAMLDYGFSQMKCVSFDGSDFSAELPLVGAEQQSIRVCGGQGGEVPLPIEEANQVTCRVLLPAFCYAPVQKGERLGRLQYYLGESPVYSVPIFAEDDVAVLSKEPSFWEKLFAGWRGRGS
ncbi:MAG: D-alanyl-D-alanine carboxypeptidase [Acutalibacter sp.]|nr:D-alanyl-D-alanine carboxypeptidase [Acutalibacter sp.]